MATWAGVTRQTVHANFTNRAELLTAVADHARNELDAPSLSQPIYEAPTAVEALQALVDFHVIFTPQMMRTAVIVEYERLYNSDIEKAFENRVAGRRQIVRHVITRLRAENALADTWTIDTATDLTSALTSWTTTLDLIDHRGWTSEDLRARILAALQHLLLRPTHQEDQP